ncbi:MAG: Rpn family recombination-promoting nuclease/putative transposase [Desulfobacterales bacterium]|nr:Rpn family recombination-promoting nuclease/putative transposase [Desulfobacterales bacterium]
MTQKEKNKTDDIAQNPHDKFFKETMTRRENALSFFREYLPPDIVSSADWRTLKIAKSSFVEKNRERFSDIVYEVLVKGKLLLIYLLMEHQSSVDRKMPLRFLFYLASLWDLWWKQNPDEKKLPGIIPVLFYHGKEGWNVSLNFRDMVDEPELTEEYIPKFSYVLRDFSHMSSVEIGGNIMLRLFLSVMGRIFSPGFTEEIDRMLPMFVELSQKKTGMEYIETVLRYIYNVTEEASHKQIETKIVQVLDESRKGDIMTIAERLKTEGKIETYQDLLDKGLLPKELAEREIAKLKKKLEQVDGSKKAA